MIDQLQQSNPGMSPAAMEALRRRGGTNVQSPQLNQASPDTRMPNLAGQPINPSEVGTPAAPSAPKPEFQPQTQDDLIIMTLTEQLGRNNKLEKEKMKMAQPQEAPSTPQTQPSPPQQGGDVLSQPNSSPTQQQSNYPF
ncbi:MAG: hypothetical protein GY861_03255 [bacterium]|nr:hypothetical protein [bacterium]